MNRIFSRFFTVFSFFPEKPFFQKVKKRKNGMVVQRFAHP
jgi:hypothetical protein